MAGLQEFTEIPAKIRSCSKNVLYLSVKVIGTELLIENTFLRLLIETTPPLPPSHAHTHTRFWVAIRTTRKSSCLRSKDCAFFLRYLKTTMSIGPVPGIKPATFSFRSVKKIGVLSEQYSLLYDWIC